MRISSSILYLGLIPGLWLITCTLILGLPQLRLETFLISPSDAGRAGGLLSIIISTLLILTITLVISVPLASATALAMTYFRRYFLKLSRLLSLSLDVLSAIPSVIFGLFGNVLFVEKLNLGHSILSGGLTLAFMILPTMVRTLESSYHEIEKGYAKTTEALGINFSTFIYQIVFPLGLPALIFATILGMTRAMAETAALLFTSGYSDRMPESVLDSGRSMSVHIYELAMNVPGGDKNAYLTAALLVFILLTINSAITYFGYHLNKRLGIL